MALGFGRKKNAPDAPETDVPTPPVSAPASTPAPAATEADDDLDHFDLDSFAAELESGKGLGQSLPPSAARQSPAPAESGSAFDFPETFTTESTVEAVSEPEPLDLNKMFEVESRDAVASGKIPAPAPYVPPSAANNVTESETPFYEEQVPVEKPKKKLPLVPIVGALVLLGLAGGAATFFGGGGDDAEMQAPAPIAARPPVPPPDTAPDGAPPAPAAPASAAPAPAAPGKPTAVKPPAPAVKPPQVKSGAAAMIPLTPALQAQLKALWKKGAAAKKSKDYAGARAAWQQALKLRPGHPGFADSIAKLPK